MRIPKRYGQSKVDSCPFCGRQATTKNGQGVPVCFEHKKEELQDMKCACGDWLDVMSGKYGTYFNCLKCGNISWAKAMEVNTISTKAVREPDKSAGTTVEKKVVKTKKEDSEPKSTYKEIEDYW